MRPAVVRVVHSDQVDEPPLESEHMTETATSIRRIGHAVKQAGESWRAAVEPLVARLAEAYGDRLHVALCFHHSRADNVVHRGLLALAKAPRTAEIDPALPGCTLTAPAAGVRQVSYRGYFDD